MIYVGTDDGLIQVTEDGGESWRKVDGVPGVPERTYVSDLEASIFDENTVYATFDNHKMGDFAPYVAVSRDKGLTWKSIRGDLPDRQVAYTLIQDHVNKVLLFLGTEFGLFVTVDEGTHWHQLKGGLPTIQVRELDIQRDWEDLALATFGRGFYILDDYSPLRGMTEERLASEDAILFPTREALRYIEQSDRVIERGDGFWTASNPPYGAVFTYWLRDGFKTKRELRHETEKKARKDKSETPLRVDGRASRGGSRDWSPECSSWCGMMRVQWCAGWRPIARRASTGWPGTCGGRPPRPPICHPRKIEHRGTSRIAARLRCRDSTPRASRCGAAESGRLSSVR